MHNRLAKSMDPKAEKALTKRYSAESEQLTDANYQSTLNRSSHPHVERHLMDPVEGKRFGKLGGISPKYVFEYTPTQQTLFDKPLPEGDRRLESSRNMLKAYHSRADSNMRQSAPTPHYGWATIATHGLFHAAGLGDMVEDVSLVKHKGKWLTSHKFNKDAQPLSSDAGREAFEQNALLPEQLGKVAVVDFLTGNVDRHFGNIMIDPKTQKPLAIDHDANMQYRRFLHVPSHIRTTGAHNLRDYLDTALRYIGRGASNLKMGLNRPHYEQEAIADWYLENRNNLNAEMQKHLLAIKDSHVKDHINANWTARMNHLDRVMGDFKRKIDEGEDYDEAKDMPFSPGAPMIHFLKKRRSK